MTERTPAPDPPDGESSNDSVAPTEQVLETFKVASDRADDQGVNDGTIGRPRLDWHPVTDGGAGGGTMATGSRSGFQFDLGSALARIGGDDDATDEHADRPPEGDGGARTQPAVTAADPLLDVLPRRRKAAPESIEQTDIDRVVEPVRFDTPPTFGSDGSGGSVPQRTVEELPRRGVSARADDAPTPTADPLPRRTAPDAIAPSAPVRPIEQEPPSQIARPEVIVESPAPEAPAPVRRTPATSRRSVFEDGLAPAVPTIPRTPTSIPSNEPTSGGQAMPDRPTAVAPAAATVPTPTLPDAPYLPAMTPATPMIAPPIESAPSTPDLHALRSAQLRANRQQRSGKLVGRTLLALLVLGGLVAAALVFGRDYLFPVEWDQALTPIVDEVEQSHGAEFDHTVALNRQPSADYALTVSGLIVDSRWVERVPEWRALGLAAGDPTPNSVGPVLAANRLAVYDPDADRIYLDAAADPAAAAADLRVALEAAYAAQFDADPVEAEGLPAPTSFTGVSARSVIAERAVASYLANRMMGPGPSVADSVTADPAGPAASAIPVPIAYELAAVGYLGEALLGASGVDPTSVDFVTGHPETIGDALDDVPGSTTSGVLQIGERPLADPQALGVDDWSLVWAQHLPASTVESLARAVNADSYRPIDRNGTTCVVGVFQSNDPAESAFVLASMTSWVAAAPPASQAAATALSDTRVQLVTCDPGTDASPPDPAVVDALIDRQLLRLAG